MSLLAALEAAERWVDDRQARHGEPPLIFELVDFLLEEAELPTDLGSRLEALVDRCDK